MVERISDIHMHIVPCVDDGSASLEMSEEMLLSAYEQGARDIFCASHGVYFGMKRDIYFSNLAALRAWVREKGLDLRLLTGNEIRFSASALEDNIASLDDGLLLTLNETRFVLTEFSIRVLFEEALQCTEGILAAGYRPIIAHAERCHSLTAEELCALREAGAELQVNAYSFTEESMPDVLDRARALLRADAVSYIGSDAHRVDCRPPRYRSGVEYILEHCARDRARAILTGNAEERLLGRMCV